MITEKTEKELQELQAELTKEKDLLAQTRDKMHETITKIDKIEKEQNLA